MNKKYPRIGTLIIAVRDGKFVMGQRKGAHGAGTWSFPGGAIEYGEDWSDTGHRELQEETGLYIDGDLDLLCVSNDYNPEWDTHWYTLWLIGNCLSGEPAVTEPDKFINLGWYSLGDMPNPLFFPLGKIKEQAVFSTLQQRLTLD